MGMNKEARRVVVEIKEGRKKGQDKKKEGGKKEKVDNFGLKNRKTIFFSFLHPCLMTHLMVKHFRVI